MSEAKEDMTIAAQLALEFIQWVAAEHGIDNSAAADLILLVAETEPDRLALLKDGFQNRSKQLLFNFE